MTTRFSYDQLRHGAGLDLGTSRWVTVDQDRIDRFATVSEDYQWIHVDTKRAAEGPFGSTIAHGYLTVTLAGSLLGELLRVEPSLIMVNYGLDSVRFRSPVPAASRVRARVEIDEVTESARGLRLALAASGEIEGGDRPVCLVRKIVLVSQAGA